MAESKDKNERFKEIIAHLKDQRGDDAAYVAHRSQILSKVRDLAQVQATESQKITMASMRGEDLEKLALLDPLTDLYNYRTFIKELKFELNRARRYQQAVALCMISIDNFEQLSKQYGSLTADAVLKIIGNAIRHSVREVDIAGRYDRHCFIIALANSGVTGGAIVAERIRQRIGAQAISYNWESFSLTSSFGVSAYPHQADEWDALIAFALDAMEHAAARGGDRVLAV
jgi:two-component system cell cycle response regulator